MTNDENAVEFLATIATGMKILAKSGRAVVKDGHLGLLRENGDLIASAPVGQVQVKKPFLYFLTPQIHVLVDGEKFLLLLAYEAAINAGQDDATAKDHARADNERFFALIRNLGGRA